MFVSVGLQSGPRSNTKSTGVIAGHKIHHHNMYPRVIYTSAFVVNLEPLITRLLCLIYSLYIFVVFL